MMTLEVFKEHILKGKTEAELYDLIEDFKIEMIFLKVQIEQKNIGDLTMPPTEMMSKINHYRLYIRDTYKQIEKNSGPVERLEDDQFAFEFQANLANLKKLAFSMEDNAEYSLTIEGNRMLTLKNNKEVVPSIEKENFLQELSKLNLGEWRERYSASDYGLESLEKQKWQVSLYFSNDMTPAEFGGSNAFPYNFGTFEKLIKKVFNE